MSDWVKRRTLILIGFYTITVLIAVLISIFEKDLSTYRIGFGPASFGSFDVNFFCFFFVFFWKEILFFFFGGGVFLFFFLKKKKNKKNKKKVSLVKGKKKKKKGYWEKKGFEGKKGGV